MTFPLGMEGGNITFKCSQFIALMSSEIVMNIFFVYGIVIKVQMSHT